MNCPGPAGGRFRRADPPRGTLVGWQKGQREPLPDPHRGAGKAAARDVLGVEKGAAPRVRSLFTWRGLRLVVGRGLVELPGCFLERLVRSFVYRSGLEGRCAGGESEAFEDLSGDHCIFDGRKESEGGSAAGATKRVHPEHALE